MFTFFKFVATLESEHPNLGPNFYIVFLYPYTLVTTYLVLLLLKLYLYYMYRLAFSYQVVICVIHSIDLAPLTHITP